MPAMVAHGLYILYFGLHTVALVCLPVLTITLVWPKRSAPTRHPILPVNTGLWACYALSSLLLLFTNSFSGPEPPRITCYIQSALELAFRPAVASAALSLVVTVWIHAWFVESERTFHVTRRKTKLMLIVLPFFTFLSFLIPGLIIGSRTSVNRAIFYCVLDYHPFIILSGATAATFLFGTVIFQVWTVAIVYRRFVGSRATDIGDFEAATFFRVLAFGVYVFVALIMCCIATKHSTRLDTDLITAAIGPTLFLTFATEDSVLRAWRLKAALPLQERCDSTVSMNQARRQSIHPSSPVISNGPPSNILRVLASFDFPQPPTPSTVQANDLPSLPPQAVVPFIPSTVPLIKSPTIPNDPHHTMPHRP